METPAERAFDAVEAGEADTLIILENDLYRRLPAETVDSFLESATHVVVLDHLENDDHGESGPGASRRHLRRSRRHAGEQRRAGAAVLSGFPAPTERDIRKAGAGWAIGMVVARMTSGRRSPRRLPQLARRVAAAPPAKLPHGRREDPARAASLQRTHPMPANISVHEPKPPDDPDSPSRLFHGGLFRPAAWRAASLFLGARMELHSGGEQISERDRRCVAGGDPGVRLIEPSQGRQRTSTAMPAAFARREAEWLLVPIEHIFGSEELSLQAPAVAELAPSPTSP